MPKTGWSPGMVPYGADETVYLVVDSFPNETVYRETEIEKADLETIVGDLLPANTIAPSASWRSTRSNTGPKMSLRT
jgi:hypothetical protein